MTSDATELREDAVAIWRAGLDAVRSDRLIEQHVQARANRLTIGDETISLDSIRRIAVVGAGKAGAGMAAGLESALGSALMSEKRLTGWVNVPENCVRPLKHITLHAARPASVNEPTEDGVYGTRRILDVVASLSEDDLCLCLISGGGSALMPAPVESIRLEDKQTVTRLLSEAGANIQQLNTVRKHLSRVKGGGLARACRAGRLYTLVISDVLGDPLDVIASGPTVEDNSTPADALAVLEAFHAEESGVSPAVFSALRQAAAANATPPPPTCRVHNLVIGNNATAVEAARQEALRRGYDAASDAADDLEGSAEEQGTRHARMAIAMRSGRDPHTAFVSGGEPVVELAEASVRGLGGRNQQLALAALAELMTQVSAEQNPLEGIVLLSGGTDGEDGPTDAAGAWIDSDVWETTRRAGLDPREYLERNDAYHFFEATGGLIKTGPTDTNVCDVRVVLVARPDGT